MTKAKKQAGDRYTVPGLERGLLLLCEFSRQEPVLGAPELSRRLDIPRTTVFRLLNTLENMGFIEKVERGHAYRLGIGVLKLGFEYLASLEMTELSEPILRRVRDETGLSCNLAVRDGQRVVIIAKIAAPTPFVSTVHVGTRLPLHATLLGRVLLSDMSLEELRQIYPEDELERFSARTPRNTKELYELVRKDAERGYGYDEAFFEPEVASAAVAVRDRTGELRAVLGVTIPVRYLQTRDLNPEQLVKIVRDAANELSSALGYFRAQRK